MLILIIHLAVFYALSSPVVLSPVPDEAPPVKLTLTVVPTSGTVPLVDREVTVTFVNTSDRTVFLDQQTLNPSLMVRMYDRDGAELGRLPCALPRESTESDLVRLEPGAEYQERFLLEQVYHPLVFEEEHPHGPYKIRCCYKESKENSSSRLPFTPMTVCADPVSVS